MSLKLLSGERFSRMIECSVLLDALKILYEVNYADGLIVGDVNDFEEILEHEWKSIVSFVRSTSAESAATDCFLLAVDILNLKVLMKRKYMRTESQGLLSEYGLFDIDAAATSVLEDEYSFLPKELSDAMGKIDEEFHAGNRKPIVIDVLLDRAYYSVVSRLLKKCKSREVKDYFALEIDGKNLLSLFRVKKAGLGKGYFQSLLIKGGNICHETFETAFSEGIDNSAGAFSNTVFADVANVARTEFDANLPFFETEQKIFNLKRNLIVAHKFDADGILPLINYFLAKKTEIENLRLVFVGIKNGTDKGKITTRLKELYV